MPAQCHFTGKKTSRGMKRAWRGQAVAKGGFGLKPTGISPRAFRPNLQTVTCLLANDEGVLVPTRVKASAKAIRGGMVVKPLKRKYGYTAQQKAKAAGH